MVKIGIHNVSLNILCDDDDDGNVVVAP